LVGSTLGTSPLKRVTDIHNELSIHRTPSAALADGGDGGWK